MLEKVKTATFFITPYSFLVAILYQLGYWTPFDINVFSYLTLNDIILMSIIPLFALLFTVLIGFLLATILKPVNTIDDYIDKSLSEGSSKTRKIIFSLVLVVVIGSILYTLFEDSEKILQNVLLLILMVTSYALLKTSFLRSLIINKSVRYFTLFFMCVIPHQAFFIGQSQSNKILNDDWSNYVSASDLNKTSLADTHELIYLGKAGDFFFLLTVKEKDVLIKTIDDFTDLRIRKKIE